MGRYELVQLGNDDEGAQRIVAVTGKGKQVAEIRLKVEDEMVFITYLYVRDEYRRRGVGSFLLQSVMDIIAKRGMFTPVECVFMRDDELRMDEFFETQPNFAVVHESHTYRIGKKARSDNAFWHRILRRMGDGEPYFELDEYIRNDFIKKLEAKNLLSFIDMDKSAYEQDLSLADVRDGEIKAAIFVKKHAEKELELSFVYADDEKPHGLYGLFSLAADTVEHEYKDFDLWFTAVNPQSHALADLLIKNDGEGLITKETVCRAAWLGWSMSEVKDLYSLAGEN